jgi:hypothetical protein
MNELTRGTGTDSLPTISSGISKLRTIISENQHGDNIYARAANGSFPLVVHAENEVVTLHPCLFDRY